MELNFLFTYSMPVSLLGILHLLTHLVFKGPYDADSIITIE